MIPDQVFQNLLQALIVAIAAVGVYVIKLGASKLVAYLEAKIGQTETERLRSMAVTIVKALQQSPAFENLGGEQKKEMAIVQITQWAEQHKLPIDREYIDRVIEEAVLTMKAELK